ncbi:hypothetical protein C495_14722 [Natronorubrum sulfidifaciens JCM 14089]|uniref:Uncharacterized protein n=1 Tax=Natronorubrum sulfidifaciens JCM 14089 TaxID=1230460 RepID=L9VZV0_9EURY|nr:hypothetical protein C495_14722 [Natronorubrum sulfidifaciens JCM 14089]
MEERIPSVRISELSNTIVMMELQSLLRAVPFSVKRGTRHRSFLHRDSTTIRLKGMMRVLAFH